MVSPDLEAFDKAYQGSIYPIVRAQALKSCSEERFDRGKIALLSLRVLPNSPEFLSSEGDLRDQYVEAERLCKVLRNRERTLKKRLRERLYRDEVLKQRDDRKAATDLRREAAAAAAAAMASTSAPEAASPEAASPPGLAGDSDDDDEVTTAC